MSSPSKSTYLKEAVGLLVQHFGAERVRDALEKVSIEDDQAPLKSPRKSVSPNRITSHPTVVDALESIRERDPEKHCLLIDFRKCIKDRTVLPESQDIRHFAQLIGLKDIEGKSRKDMIPTLMRFLFERPTERLRIDIQSANSISEQHRQKGFSVLTDKLLGEK